MNVMKVALCLSLLAIALWADSAKRDLKRRLF